ncbi:MAG: SGNH/GDSL hydrolase family protein [Candidatus Alcyoniella australis]|nr:SGNH/GDSL hydrolase family protein [Candidatus Alcyoniella australis]
MIKLKLPPLVIRPLQVLTAIVCLVILGELSLYLIGYEGNPAAWDVRLQIADHKVGVPDDLLFWRPPIDPSFPDDKIKVLCVGDQVGLGPQSGGWPEVLQQRLLDLPLERQAAIFNGCVDGYSSTQGLRYVERHLGLEPDVIVSCFGVNDYQTAKLGLPDDQFQHPSSSTMSFRSRALRSRGYRFYREVLYDLRRIFKIGQRENVLRVSIDRFEGNMDRLVQHGEVDGIDVLLMTSPAPNLDQQWLAEHRRYNERLRKVGRDTGAPVIDLEQTFESNLKLFIESERHPERLSPEGAQVMALAVRDALLNSGVVRLSIDGFKPSGIEGAENAER